MTCENCRFWEEDKSGKPTNGVIMGYCHRNPPAAMACVVPKLQRVTNKMIPTLIEVTVWPKTMVAAWCGGFEVKKKPTGLLETKRITNDRD